MRSRQLKETRRSLTDLVLTPLDLAQQVYDKFEEPPDGIKLWNFACCDNNLQSSWDAAMCACCFMSWHVECVDDCAGGPHLGPKQCNFLKRKRKASDKRLLPHLRVDVPALQVDATQGASVGQAAGGEGQGGGEEEEGLLDLPLQGLQFRPR